ncbi:MAG: glycosyltransferase family 39 protein [Chloroflexota bacterium]|nr:glycosyltransferase family 39 protein [Chloroflexota bacterium]
MTIAFPRRALALILVGGLCLRAVLWLGVSFPGVADPNHYYNLGVRLVGGNGFTNDYIWQYSGDPAALVHPEAHWMPLTAALAAVPMALFGVSPRVALIAFVILGAFVPLLTYWGARRLEIGTDGALFAAAAGAALPELVLNSLRTDTTLPFALLASGALLCMTRRTVFAAILAGALTGLAYLTRNDGLLLVPTAILFNLIPRPPLDLERGSRPAPNLVFNVVGGRGVRLVVFLLAALIVVAPWLARNLAATGALGSPETRSMWFFTHHDDHYAYGRTFTLDTLLAAQTPAQIIGKRAFEMAAAVVMMLRAFGDALAVAVVGGIGLVWFTRRDDAAGDVGARPVSPVDAPYGWSRWARRAAPLLPVLIFIIGAFVAYTVLLPYKAQAGSYKKAFLGVVPLLLPFAGLALERAISDARIRRGAMALIIGALTLNAIQLVRTDVAATDAYVMQVRAAADVARDLPDTNGDGAIILMTQDPYIVRTVGFQSIIYPYEPRDTIAAAAARYGVDYLLMPANRPALNALYAGAEMDARFVRAADVPGTPFVFFRFAP